MAYFRACFYGNNLIFLSLFLFFVANFIFWHLHYPENNAGTFRYSEKISNLSQSENSNRWKEVMEDIYQNRSFEGFNNVTGLKRFIVPNIIHFFRYNQLEYSFIDYVVIKAAMRNHRPEYFYIHTDVPGPGNFTGRYWSLIKEDYELWSRIRLLHLDLPEEIFGQKLNSGW